MSTRKKWGKTTQKTERLIRDAVPKPETLEELDQYVAKARSVTEYDLANKFNIRMSIARNILREKEAAGTLVPYVREGGLVVYTSHAEMEKRQGGRHVVLADALEEVASSAPARPVITEEMEAALTAASVESLKPSKVLRQRREVGERKERERERRPEVIIEPLPTAGPEKPPTEPVKKPPRAEESVVTPRAPAVSPATATPTIGAREGGRSEAESKPPKKAAKKTETVETKPAAKPAKKAPAKSTKKASTEGEKPARTAAKRDSTTEGKPVRKTAKKAEDAEKKPKKPAAKE